MEFNFSAQNNITIPNPLHNIIRLQDKIPVHVGRNKYFVSETGET